MARSDHGLPGIYNSSAITLATGEGAALALDSAGRLIWSPGGSLGYAIDDSAMPATPSIVPVGGEYRSSATTYTDGDGTVLQTNINGFLITTLGTALAGEDLTNNVMKVEQRFSYSAVAVVDTQVKATAGFLHTVTIACNDAAPTAGSLIIYDNTAESGTVVFNHTFTTTPFVPFTVILDYTMATGIYVGMTTTGDVNFSCSYR